MSCACREPDPCVDPRRASTCQRCGKPIDQDADWIVNDRTHAEYLDRVEHTLRAALKWPSKKPPPPEWLYFRQLCLQREQDGRDRFGLGYLGRDNIQAGIEEDSDSENYNWFHLLQTIKMGETPEWDLVLTLAFHNYMAYLTRLRIKAKQRGEP